MRVLSAKLELVPDFEREDLYAIITEWLKGNYPTQELGERLETTEKTDRLKLEAGYCTIETFSAVRENIDHHLIKLTHIFYAQTWETEIIFLSGGQGKTLVIHIDCSGEPNIVDETPMARSEVIRCFVNSGRIRSGKLPVVDNPLFLSGELVDWLAGVINGSSLDMPLVFVTKIFNSAGYEVDIDRMAQKLSGLAVVLAEKDDHYVSVLREKTNAQNPYNGYIGVYFPGNVPGGKIFNPSKVPHGTLEKTVVREVVRYVTAKVDQADISWDSIYYEKAVQRAIESEELLNEAFSENASLDEQLRQAKERIHKLVKENTVLTAQKTALQDAVRRRTSGRLLRASDIPEFFAGEQYDLIVSALTKALQNYQERTRAYELLRSIIGKNPLIGNGKRIEEVLKSVLSGAENPTERDLAALHEVGFEVVSENKHYKLIFHGDERYVFTLAKTPGDNRGGKNNVSDIRKKISVYH